MMISRQTQDTLITKTEMGLVGEILINRLDDLQAAILSSRHPLFDSEKLQAQVQAFAELSSAVVKEIEVRRDGEWGQRLLKDRAAVGNVMDGIMDKAPRRTGGGPAAAEKHGPQIGRFFACARCGKAGLGSALCQAGGGLPQFRPRAALSAPSRRPITKTCAVICAGIMRIWSRNCADPIRCAEPMPKPSLTFAPN